MDNVIVVDAGDDGDDSVSPERREAGRLSLREFEAVLADPDHRLHSAASEMTRELGESMSSALGPIVGELNKRIQPGLEALARAIGRSFDVGAGWKVNVPAAAPDARGDSEWGYVSSSLTVQDEATGLEVQVPDGSTADDVRRLLEGKLDEVVGALYVVAQRIDHNADRDIEHQRQRASKEDELVKDGKDRERRLDGRHVDTSRVAKSGVVASWLAALFSFAALIVAIIASMPPG